MSRKHFVGRFSREFKTARCILIRGDQFLLARHGAVWTTTDKGWGLPGGQIERRESPMEAARRELEEELNVYLAELVEVGEYHYKRSMHKVFCATFDGEIRDWDNTELKEIRWFSLAEVQELEDLDQLHAGYECSAVEAAQELV